MWVTTFLTFLFLYFLAYLYQRFYLHEKLTIYHENTPRNKEWISNIPILKKGYTPTIWAISSVIHGLISNTLRSTEDLKYIREEITGSNGQHLTYDVIEKGVCKEDTPTIFMVPGIGGHSQKQYIKSFINHVKNQRIVVFNHPGSGNTKLKIKDVHLSGDVTYVEEVLNHLQKKYTKTTFIGIGLGGNLLSRYLGVFGSNTPLKTAVVLCNAYDVYKAPQLMSPQVQKVMLSVFQEMIRNSLDIFKEVKDLNLEKVLTCKTFKEFDQEFTHKIHKIPNVEEYYKERSSRFFLEKIKIPTILLNSLDDPVVSHHLIEYDSVKNENIILLVSKRGSHGSYLQGGIIPNLETSWLEEFLLEFIESSLQLKI